MLHRVRNLETGRVSDVPDGHFALGSVRYEVLPPEPPPAPEASGKPARKRAK